MLKEPLRAILKKFRYTSPDPLDPGNIYYKRYLEFKSTRYFPDFPRGFNVSFVDNICSYKCRMCVLGQKETRSVKPVKMSEAIFQRLCEIIPNDHLTVFDCSPMGEPLLFDKLIDYLAYFRQTHPDNPMSISTNARFLTKDKARELLTIGIQNIFTSLFMGNPEDYAWLTRGKPEDYQATCQNILDACEMKKAVKSNTRISTYIFQMDRNAKYIPEFVKFWRKHVDIVFVRRLKNFCGYWEEHKKVVLKTDLGINRYPCESLWFNSNIRADGSVYPCYQAPLDKQYAIGNIMERDFPDIWNGKEMKKMREEHLSCKYDTDLCRACEYWDDFPPLFKYKDGRYVLDYPGDKIMKKHESWKKRMGVNQ